MGSLIRSTWLLYRMHLGSVLRSRRALISLLLAAAPPALAYVVTRFEDGVEGHEILGYLGAMVTLQVVTPILSLLVGSAVVTEEIENRTITYVFTRPIQRAALFLGRWLATLTLVSLLLGASAGVLIVVAGQAPGELPSGLPARIVVATLFGGAVYSMIAAVLGVFLRRPMVVSLGYAFAFEFLIANIPSSTQALSVQYYLRSILIDKTHEFWQGGPPFIDLVEFQSPTEACLRLSVTLLLATIVGAVGISRRQYVLTA